MTNDVDLRCRDDTVVWTSWPREVYDAKTAVVELPIGGSSVDVPACALGVLCAPSGLVAIHDTCVKVLTSGADCGPPECEGVAYFEAV